MPLALIPLLIRRTLVLWILLRLLLAIAGAVVRVGLGPSPGTSVRVVALLAVVSFLDLRRRGERILWGNLGAGLPMLLAGVLIIGLLAETVLAIVLRGLHGLTG